PHKILSAGRMLGVLEEEEEIGQRPGEDLLRLRPPRLECLLQKVREQRQVLRRRRLGSRRGTHRKGSHSNRRAGGRLLPGLPARRVRAHYGQGRARRLYQAPGEYGLLSGRDLRGRISASE